MCTPLPSPDEIWLNHVELIDRGLAGKGTLCYTSTMSTRSILYSVVVAVLIITGIIISRPKETTIPESNPDKINMLPVTITEMPVYPSEGKE